MPRKHGPRMRGQRGSGVGSDLLKKLLMESVGLVPKLLEGPAKEFGDYLGTKVKKLTGGRATPDQVIRDFNRLMIGSGNVLAGENRTQNGEGARLSGEGFRLSGDNKRKKKVLSPYTA